MHILKHGFNQTAFNYYFFVCIHFQEAKEFDFKN
jgi:hypothetical protein